MKTTTYTIYALVDPQTHEVRYVGRTRVTVVLPKATLLATPCPFTVAIVLLAVLHAPRANERVDDVILRLRAEFNAHECQLKTFAEKSA